MNEIQIRKADDITIDEQVRVYIDAFDHEESEYEEIRTRWEIKHKRNPYGESYVFGAFDGNKLVGMNCFLRMRYQYQGKEIKVLQSCESGVLKSYQRQGIWGKIMAFAREYLIQNTDIDVLIGFPNYKNSYPGFVKMGWKTLFFEKNLLFITNGYKAIKMYLKDDRYLLLGKLFEMQNILLIKYKTKQFQVLLEESYCTKHSDGSSLSLINRNEWIAWKSNYAFFSYYKVKKDGMIAAHILTETDTKNGISYLKIVDIAFRGNEATRLGAVAAFIQYIKQKKYALIRVWDKSGDFYRKLGFVERKKHLSPFIINVLKDEKDFLVDQNLWCLNFLDLDG